MTVTSSQGRNAPRVAGRHFLQIPGPTPVPDRILQATARALIDHRGPDFQRLCRRILDGLPSVLKTTGPVIVYPSSGTGAWEAALSNTLSEGDTVLMFETGHFAFQWKQMAERLGLHPIYIESDWRRGVNPQAIAEELRKDKDRKIKAVCVAHSETSTGCMSSIEAIRKAIDDSDHPALLMVDTISSLASVDYRQDDWRVDVTVGGSQKGLMLPPGLSFTGVSAKALQASKSATMKRSYFDWQEMLAMNAKGFFPYTPATNLLYGLAEAIDMLHEEGLDNVYARHHRLGEAARRAVQAWGLENQCADPAYYSATVTTVRLPDGQDADRFRALVLEHFDMSLGAGLNKLAGKVFRIGHLGDTNDLTILGALSGVEMGLSVAAVPHRKGGVQAAIEYLADKASHSQRLAA